MIDNLPSVKIVLANGDIVTVSEAQNADLFWAVRGAGQNFGVVVELKFRVHEMDHEVYSGYLFFVPEKLEEVVEFMCTLPEESGGRVGGGMCLDVCLARGRP
jgi:FAD/FMN-containing dehydrogenase